MSPQTLPVLEDLLVWRALPVKVRTFEQLMSYDKYAVLTSSSTAAHKVIMTFCPFNVP